ncbi:hypothetical protein HDV05_005179 [Chytridiales sp. JEL 0842]|nr:hypothetical protein HDV05_005179 [Chytridiales sp. JEL 0842]
MSVQNLNKSQLLNRSSLSINASIETEEILGPLPSNWVKAEDPRTGRPYFVDKAAKKTTWVDPRTFRLRKHNIKELVPGELGYGWGEEVDQETGEVYFVDHLNKRNYWKAPWEKETQEQVLKLQERMAAEERRQQADKDLEARKSRAMQNAEREISELERQKRALEQALANGNLANAQQQNANDALSGLLQRNLSLNDQANKQNSQASLTDNNFEQSLAELRALSKKLDEENQKLKDETKAANLELSEIRQMIEAERAQRQALESYIFQLQHELLAASNSTGEPINTDVEQDDEEEEDVLAGYTSLDASARVEALKKRLVIEQEEREKLREITENLLQERDEAIASRSNTIVKNKNRDSAAPSESGKALGARDQETVVRQQPSQDEDSSYQAPAWIKNIDLRSRSRSLKKRIAESMNNPEELDFQDKILRFDLQEDRGSLQQRIDASLPSPLRSDKAIRARETAFGKVVLESQ